jgi:hypothetical protein
MAVFAAHDNWTAAVTARPLAIVTILPAQRISSLKYLGAHFERVFNDEGYATLQSILDRLRRHTRVQNGAWLRDILENPNQQQCVGSNSPAKTHGRGHRYRVRSYNKFAYNAIVTYARHWLPASHRHRIPRLLGDRTQYQAFPDVC